LDLGGLTGKTEAEGRGQRADKQIVRLIWSYFYAAKLGNLGKRPWKHLLKLGTKKTLREREQGLITFITA